MKTTFKPDFDLCRKALHWSTSCLCFNLVVKDIQYILATSLVQLFPLVRVTLMTQISAMVVIGCCLVTNFMRKNTTNQRLKSCIISMKSESEKKDSLSWKPLTLLQSFWSFMMFVLLYISSISLLFSWGTKIWLKKHHKMFQYFKNSNMLIAWIRIFQRESGGGGWCSRVAESMGRVPRMWQSENWNLIVNYYTRNTSNVTE